MELKYPSVTDIQKNIPCSNRTFMELKLHHFSWFVGPLGCSNRTFMELKLEKGSLYD